MSNATATTATTASININSTNQSASPPSSGPSSNMSPLTAILSLLVLVAIPAFIYAFFFAINCPRIPLIRRFRRSSGGEGAADFSNNYNKKSGNNLESFSTIRYTKEAHGEDYGGECPVCLSVFVEGDGVRQLTGCKHSFHVACIDKWLYSHSSCPLCRASVPNSIKRSQRPAPPETEQDLRQGLPDAASLV